MAQRSVEIETADGICPAALSIPDGEGPWPAVIMFADAGGMRDTIRFMGERLSALGYVVLVPDFYYRNGPYEPVDMRTAFQEQGDGRADHGHDVGLYRRLGGPRRPGLC